jgi:hypothetical protein
MLMAAGISLLWNSDASDQSNRENIESIIFHFGLQNITLKFL